MVRVSYRAMHIEGHLAELDINPLMVLPSGQGVKAVDALVVFRGTLTLGTQFKGWLATRSGSLPRRR
jgi:hypothetical protein